MAKPKKELNRVIAPYGSDRKLVAEAYAEWLRGVNLDVRWSHFLDVAGIHFAILRTLDLLIEGIVPDRHPFLCQLAWLVEGLHSVSGQCLMLATLREEDLTQFPSPQLP